MSKAKAPLSGPLGDDLAKVMESEGNLGDVVVTDIVELPWPPRRLLGSDVPTARAGVAAATMHDYVRHAYGSPVGLEVQSAMIDAVSDLMHLADALGLDWSYVTEMAGENHADEVE